MAASGRQKLLEITDLKISFRQGGISSDAVNGISFDVFSDETLAIVGESGSGKSVTALSLMKLIPDPPGTVDAGKMTFFHPNGACSNLLTASGKEMQHIRGKSISMIFQEPMTSLNPVFTCGDQVCEGIHAHKKLTKKQVISMALDLFGEVGLQDPLRIFRSYPHQLSGGQKQRVMIAMAISCDPSLLIADEPTTALDVTVQKKILQLLNRIKETRKMGILFITHDLRLVSGFADRVMVMHRGNIVEQGLTGKVFFTPGHPYTKGLLASRPPTDVRLRKLPTVADFTGNGSSAREVIGSEERAGTLSKLYSAKPVLHVRDLVRTFSGVRAVDHISFDVYPGETLGIVGESGSGKTTLVRTVLKLLPPDSGSILFKGKDITSMSSADIKPLRKHLQIIFQDPYSSLNPRLTAGAAIMEPMKVHRLHASEKGRKDKVIELLEKVGLEAGHFNRYPHEFSGGQRQRICIARALAVEPELIICDESVSALDVSVQAQVLNLLNNLKMEFGLTYIFISHDLSVVRYMSHRMIIMKDGKIVETGDADSLFSNPQNEYSANLINAIPHPGFLG